MIDDIKTADAFADSWNNLADGSVYTKQQFEDWMLPLTQKDIQGHSVLEMGCGNGSLMVHVTEWFPSYMEGVDLGDSVKSATNNLKLLNFKNWKITKADIVTFESKGFDLVYCIGVLHHLKKPKDGLGSVIRNVKPGGRFHCWVYAREGNGLIVYIVDPIRKLASRFPWWFTKYFVATSLVSIYFLYAKFLSHFEGVQLLKKLPLYDYSIWIGKREFAFFRHVAFDQLVSPQTTYIDKQTIESWLQSFNNIKPGSSYIIMRNRNSWKFGGVVI